MMFSTKILLKKGMFLQAANQHIRMISEGSGTIKTGLTAFKF